MLRVFGRLPDTGVTSVWGQASEKPQGRKPRGELPPAVMSVYGDLAPVFGVTWRLRTTAPGAPVVRCCSWLAWAGSGRRCGAERSASWRSEGALTVAIGGGWPLPAGYRPGPGAVMRGNGKSVLVMSCRTPAIGWSRAEAGSQVG